VPPGKGAGHGGRAEADAVALPRHARRARALLALGFAGAFRRYELVALQVEDLAETPDGLRIAIRRSKTEQEGQGAEVAILRGCRLRPVEAVQSWLAGLDSRLVRPAGGVPDRNRDVTGRHSPMTEWRRSGGKRRWTYVVAARDVSQRLVAAVASPDCPSPLVQGELWRADHLAG
jgi:integrase